MALLSYDVFKYQPQFVILSSDSAKSRNCIVKVLHRMNAELKTSGTAVLSVTRHVYGTTGITAALDSPFKAN